VVGTDVFHAAILLAAAAVAHIFGGNVDFTLAGNILIGSIPGVVIGSQLSVKWPQNALRMALAVVLVVAGIALFSKSDTSVVPWALGATALGLGALFGVQVLLRKEVEGDPDEKKALAKAREPRQKKPAS